MNEAEKYRALVEEQRRRRQPASDEDIIGLAETIWADPALREAFKRAGLHGDLTDAEYKAMDKIIDAYRQGPMWDRSLDHLQLAEGLLRRWVEGEFADLADPSIHDFLDDRRMGGPGTNNAGWKKASFDEVMMFVHALRNDPEMWGIFQASATEGLEFLSDKKDPDWEGIQNLFAWRFRRKYSLINRQSLSLAIGHVRGVASGHFNSIEDEFFIKDLKSRLENY